MSGKTLCFFIFSNSILKISRDYHDINFYQRKLIQKMNLWKTTPNFYAFCGSGECSSERCHKNSSVQRCYNRGRAPTIPQHLKIWIYCARHACLLCVVARTLFVHGGEFLPRTLAGGVLTDLHRRNPLSNALLDNNQLIHNIMTGMFHSATSREMASKFGKEDWYPYDTSYSPIKLGIHRVSRPSVTCH